MEGIAAAYMYDDLQSSVYDRLARPGLRTITDFLDTWVSASLASVLSFTNDIVAGHCEQTSKIIVRK